MFAAKNELFTRPNGGYNLTRSLRFRSSASAYLNRTFTNEQGTYTLSLWVKRGALGVQQEIVNSRTSGAGSTSYIEFNSSDQINIQLNGTSVLTTTAVYRDPASWYHIVLRVTASATSYLYVNGTQIGSWTAGSNPFLFSNGAGYVCAIGRQGNLSAQYFDGYMAEVNYIDGQALTPSSFGAFSLYNQWLPKKYGGTYGTNGFYLPFTNNASAATLGNDFSGNSNTWTVNNISVTTGATYDSMTDVPTLTSLTAANYSTWNPLWFIGASTFASGNLIASCPANNGVYTTMYVSTGKWYAEVTPSSTIGGIGVNASTGYIPVSGGSFGYNNGDYSYLYSGNKMVNNGTQTAYGASYTTNDVIGIAIDADAGTVTMYKNNVSQGAIVTGLTGKMWVVAACSLTGTFNMTLNNGAGSGFAYTPPSGFLALNTFNL
jgi:hypothetical protein